jgi:hypothetical protein
MRALFTGDRKADHFMLEWLKGGAHMLEWLKSGALSTKMAEMWCTFYLKF